MDFDGLSNFWVARLALNLVGYATVAVPGFLLIRYVRKSGYLEKAGDGCTANIIRLFVEGTATPPDKSGEETASKLRESSPIPERSLAYQCVHLAYCSGGLLGSYLIWGLLQERIMSYDYSESAAAGERFTNSQFLVFMNRILALVVAVVTILVWQKRAHRQPPLYKYSYTSFSNILSSWCQYEALKFVSFPVQVLAKAAKVIPVMLMGRLVSRRSYPWTDYATAVAISAGLFAFLMTNTSSESSAVKDRATTTMSGLLLLAGYLAFDSFTSNWQGELFRTYRVSSVEMMAGVNFFSVLLTSASLAEQGAFSDAAAFASRHPLFVMHVLVLSATSALGQLFIFYTISQFGAVTFTIIMTVRQGLAILLSCIVYRHAVSLIGIVGILVVFVAIFVRVYLSQQKRKPSVRPTTGPNAV